MPEPEHYRLFIALTLPEAVKAELEEAQAELRRALRQARVSWTRVEQFHLTLKFLGTVEAPRVDALVAAFATRGRASPPCGCGPGNSAAFPACAPRA